MELKYNDMKILAKKKNLYELLFDIPLEHIYM